MSPPELRLRLELGRHGDAVPLLADALAQLSNGYDRDRVRYAEIFALAFAGAQELRRV